MGRENFLYTNKYPPPSCPPSSVALGFLCHFWFSSGMRGSNFVWFLRHIWFEWNDGFRTLWEGNRRRSNKGRKHQKAGFLLNNRSFALVFGCSVFVWWIRFEIRLVIGCAGWGGARQKLRGRFEMCLVGGVWEKTGFILRER